MKARHILMLIVLVIAVSMVISNKGVEQLVCTTEGELYESPSKSELVINLKDKKIRDMSITIDIYLNEEMMEQKASIIQMIEMQGKSAVSEFDKGIRLNSGMNSTYFANLGINDGTHYNELKEVLEVQGFSCK